MLSVTSQSPEDKCRKLMKEVIEHSNPQTARRRLLATGSGGS